MLEIVKMSDSWTSPFSGWLQSASETIRSVESSIDSVIGIPNKESTPQKSKEEGKSDENTSSMQRSQSNVWKTSKKTESVQDVSLEDILNSTAPTKLSKRRTMSPIVTSKPKDNALSSSVEKETEETSQGEIKEEKREEEEKEEGSVEEDVQKEEIEEENQEHSVIEEDSEDVVHDEGKVVLSDSIENTEEAMEKEELQISEKEDATPSPPKSIESNHPSDAVVPQDAIDRITQLELIISEREHQLEASVSREAALQDTLDKMTEKLSALDAGNDSISSLKRQLGVVEKERDQLRAQIDPDEEIQHVIKSLREEGEALSKKQLVMEQKVKTLRKELNGKEEQLEKLRNAQIEANQWKRENGTLVTEVKALRKSMEGAEKKIEKLEKKCVTAEERVKESEEREKRAKEMAEKEGEISAGDWAAKEKSILRKHEEEMRQLESNWSEKYAQVQATSATATAKAETLSSKSIYMEEQLRGEIQALHERLFSAEQRCNELLEGVPQATAPLLRQIESMRESMTQRSNDWEVMERRHTESLREERMRANKAMSEREEAEYALKIAQKEVEDGKRRVETLEQEKKFLGETVETLNDKLRKNMEELNHVKSEWTHTKDEWMNTKASLEVMERRLETAQAARIRAEEDRAAVVRQNSFEYATKSFSSPKTPQSEHVFELFRTPSPVRSEGNAYRYQLSELEKEKSDLEDELASAKAKLTELEKEVIEVRKTSSSIATLQKEKQEALQEAVRYQKRVKELEQDLLDLKEIYRTQVEFLLSTSQK